jgi:hypothetical protein
LPSQRKDYVTILTRFDSAARIYLNLALKPIQRDAAYTWVQFVAVCREYSSKQSTSQPQQQTDTQQPQQQQQQPSNRTPPQQQGGRQVRFQPSANGTGYEGERYGSPPARSRGSWGGRGYRPFSGSRSNGDEYYDEPPSDYGGHYSASNRSAGAVQFGRRLAGGVVRQAAAAGFHLGPAPGWPPHQSGWAIPCSGLQQQRVSSRCQGPALLPSWLQGSQSAGLRGCAAAGALLACQGPPQ